MAADVLAHHSGRTWWNRVTHIMMAMEQRQCLSLQESSFCFDFVQTPSLWGGSTPIHAQINLPKQPPHRYNRQVVVSKANHIDKVNHGWVKTTEKQLRADSQRRSKKANIIIHTKESCGQEIPKLRSFTSYGKLYRVTQLGFFSLYL